MRPLRYTLTRWFLTALFLVTTTIIAAQSSSAGVVTSVVDDLSAGSLRKAITDANNGADTPTITFDPLVFPPKPALPRVIFVNPNLGPLPNLNRASITIDGVGAGVVIDGSQLSGSEVGFRIRGSDITIRNLTIQNFPGDGIRVETRPKRQPITACLNAPIPEFFIVTDLVNWIPCPPANAFYNAKIMQAYDDKAADTDLTLCSGQSVPDGWVVIGFGEGNFCDRGPTDPARGPTYAVIRRVGADVIERTCLSSFQGTPQAYLITGIDYLADHCNPRADSISFPPSFVIERYDNKPIGAIMNVCVGQLLPVGWIFNPPVYAGRCGPLLTSLSSMQIQKVAPSKITLTQYVTSLATDVIIDHNFIRANGNRGIRISGGSNGPGKTVSANITNNEIEDSGNSGILVSGNLLDLPDADVGGNTVSAFIHRNRIKRSKETVKTKTFLGGDGIQITGGSGLGSNSHVYSTIDDNTVTENRDDGIIANGCAHQAAGSRNHVEVTITNNKVRDNGFNADLATNRGIIVSGASGEEFTSTTCVGNLIKFLISGNENQGNRSGNIHVSGGTGSGHELQGEIASNIVKGSPGNGDGTGGDGIVVTGGRGTGNQLHDISVSNNQVSRNAGRGIHIHGGTEGVDNILDGIDVKQNDLTMNAREGVRIAGGSNSTRSVISDVLLEDNRGESNGSDGIQVSPGEAHVPPTITLNGVLRNRLNRNGGNGLLVLESVPGTSTDISENQADGNLLDGLSIQSAGYLLTNNSARKNGQNGISAPGNIDGGGNTATHNKSCNTPGCF